MGCAYSQNVVDFRHQMRNSPRAFITSDIHRQSRMNVVSRSVASESQSHPRQPNADSNPTSDQSQALMQGTASGRTLISSTNSTTTTTHTNMMTMTATTTTTSQTQDGSSGSIVVVQEHENYIRYLARNNARLLVPDLAGKPCGLPIVSRFAKAQTEPYAPRPLSGEDAYGGNSLVELCLRVICRNRHDWVGLSPGEPAAFHTFPENIYQALYGLLESHNLLTLNVLKAFRQCVVCRVDLSRYPLVNDLWILEVFSLRSLTHLSLANCRNLTDQAFENANVGQNSCRIVHLDLTLCSKLTDASLARLIPAFTDTLQHLSLAKCSKVTDQTLSRILQCSRLTYLSLSKCNLLSKAYLCQLGLLSELRYLDISLIPNVDDYVVQALQPRAGMEAIIEAIATSLGRKSVVAIRESVYAKRLGNARHTNPRHAHAHAAYESTQRAHKTPSSTSSTPSQFSYVPRRPDPTSSGDISSSSSPSASSSSSSSSYHASGSSRNGTGSMSAPRLKKTRVETPDCGLSQVETLNVSWTCVGDGACEALASLHTLRSLDVSNCRLSNHVFNRLFESLHALEELHTRFSGNSKELDLCGIAKLRKLRKVNLENVAIGKLFAASAKLEELVELDLTNTECLLPNLSEVCPNLQVLKAEGLSMSSKNMRELSRLGELRELNLCDCMLNEYDFINLKWLTSLVVLDVSHSRVSDFCVKIIATSLFNLEELRMDSVLLTNHALRHLKNLRHLRDLNLFESIEISDEGLFHLSCIPTLEALEVCGGKVRDCGVKYLCGLPHLQRLNLSKNLLLTDKSLRHVADKLADSLRSLNVSRTGVTPIGLCQLTAMNKLEQLTARGLKVDKAIDSSIIAKLLSEVPTLWYILT